MIKRLVLCALLATACSAQTLLFKSGFENNTVLGPIPSTWSGPGSYIQPMSGTDTSTGFTWPISAFAPSESSGLWDIPDPSSTLLVNHFSNSIQTLTGHTGAPSNVLFASISGYTNGVCCPQAPFSSRGLTQSLKSVYVRFWMMYPSSLATLLPTIPGDYGRETAGFKTQNDYRMHFDIVRPHLTTGSTMYGSIKADALGMNQSIGNGCPYVDPITGGTDNDCNWHFAEVGSESYPVPIGQWFLVEYYYLRVNGPGGRLYAAIDGHPVGDFQFRIPNFGMDNEDVHDIYWVTLYSPAYPMSHYVDDLEIWDSPPCASLPCGTTQVGGTPPAIESYQGAVGTVGVPFSFQPVATNSPTSWHYNNYGTTGLPPGLSFNTSTGLISGTPTTTGTYKIYVNATNATGNGAQTFEIQINSALQAPVIKTFAPYPTTVGSGTPSTLFWNVLGAGTVSLSINQGVGPVTGLSSTTTVTPSATTLYILTVSNSAGSTTASTTVTVAGTTLPTISSLTATPATVAAGSPSSLAWATSNATSCSLDQGIGTVPCNGSHTVSPTATTTYTFTAANANGSTPRSITITVSSPTSSTFYVSSSTGSDSNDGLSTATPWKTIAKVNAGTYSPGAQILFRAGDTWTGTTLVTPSAGASGSPITYGAYAAGNPPILDGSGTLSPLISVTKDFVTLTHLQLQNASPMIASTGNNLTVTGNTLLNGRLPAISISSGNNVSITKNSYTAALALTQSGWVLQAITTGPITISDNVLDMTALTGSVARGIQVAGSSNPILTRNTSHGGAVAYAVVPYVSGTVSCPTGGANVTQGTVADNFADQVSSANGGEGQAIQLFGCALHPQSNFLVTRNGVLCKAGALGTISAIATQYSTNATLTANPLLGGCATDLIHLDQNSTGALIYNNTLSTPGNGITFLNGSGATVKNNIFDGMVTAIANASSGAVSEDYNQFSASVTAATSGTVTSGSHDQTGDPLFVNPTPVAINDLKVQSGSPASGTGLNLGSPNTIILDSTGTAFPYPQFTETTSWQRGAFSPAVGGGTPSSQGCVALILQ